MGGVKDKNQLNSTFANPADLKASSLCILLNADFKKSPTMATIQYEHEVYKGPMSRLRFANPVIQCHMDKYPSDVQEQVKTFRDAWGLSENLPHRDSAAEKTAARFQKQTEETLGTYEDSMNYMKELLGEDVFDEPDHDKTDQGTLTTREGEPGSSTREGE